MTTVFHAWPYSKFIEIQSSLRRKKLNGTNQGHNFFGGSFSNRHNVRAPIQFRTNSQTQNLKIWFFLKTRPIHFHINSTSVIRPVKQNRLSFSSININKLFPAQSTVSRRSDSSWAANSRYFHRSECLIKLRVESSIISTDSNITGNIIKKASKKRKKIVK